MTKLIEGYCSSGDPPSDAAGGSLYRDSQSGVEKDSNPGSHWSVGYPTQCLE